jgi:hypothetical protein
MVQTGHPHLLESVVSRKEIAMSATELERFAKDVASTPGFLEQVKAVGADYQAVVDFAAQEGYQP